MERWNQGADPVSQGKRDLTSGEALKKVSHSPGMLSNTLWLPTFSYVDGPKQGIFDFSDSVKSSVSH
jgi:hypothetical protein